MQQLSRKEVNSKINHFLDKKTRGSRFSDSLADWFLTPRSRHGSDMTDRYESLPWRGIEAKQ